MIERSVGFDFEYELEITAEWQQKFLNGGCLLLEEDKAIFNSRQKELKTREAIKEYCCLVHQQSQLNQTRLRLPAQRSLDSLELPLYHYYSLVHLDNDLVYQAIHYIVWYNDDKDYHNNVYSNLYCLYDLRDLETNIAHSHCPSKPDNYQIASSLIETMEKM